MNLEIENWLSRFQHLVVVKAFKGRKCYGIGLNDPRKDLILRNYVRLRQSEFKPYPLSTVITVTLVDVGGTSRSTAVWGTVVSIFHAMPAASVGTRLGFGNPATTPTPARTDYALAAEVARINPSETTIDETNWRVVVTGSYVWTAGGTVREAGMYFRGQSAGIAYDFLIFHDAVADVPVPAGGTVSVTYTTQF